jgi:putative transposase
MPSRLKRFQTSGAEHFITFSCYRRRPFLVHDLSCSVFLGELEKIRVRHRFLVYGYVLMPEHVHLLVSEPKMYVLGSTLNVLKCETSKVLKADRKQFWQTRYYNFNVESHDKFVEKLQYIHRNPVKRGLVERPEEYRWSSFNHWATGEEMPVEVESHWTFARREREGKPHRWQV